MGRVSRSAPRQRARTKKPRPDFLPDGALFMWAMPDSNRRPLPCEGSALPTAPIAQDPEGSTTDTTGRCEAVLTISGDTPEIPARFGTAQIVGYCFTSARSAGTQRGCSAVGSAQPCQGWGREFESRHPLECRGFFSERSRHVGSQTTRWRGRAARHRPAKPFTRVRIPSPPPLPVPTGARLGRLAQR